MSREKMIAENLRKARGNRSRAEIAEAAQVSISALSMYENAERIPRDAIKIRLSRALGVGVAELFYPEIFFAS